MVDDAEDAIEDGLHLACLPDLPLAMQPRYGASVAESFHVRDSLPRRRRDWFSAADMRYPAPRRDAADGKASAKRQALFAPSNWRVRARWIMTMANDLRS